MTTIATVFEMTPRGDGTFIAKAGKPVQWIRVSAAAKMLGVSSKTVLRRLEAGQLKGRKTGPTWRVDASAIG